MKLESGLLPATISRSSTVCNKFSLRGRIPAISRLCESEDHDMGMKKITFENDTDVVSLQTNSDMTCSARCSVSALFVVQLVLRPFRVRPVVADWWNLPRLMWLINPHPCGGSGPRPSPVHLISHRGSSARLKDHFSVLTAEFGNYWILATEVRITSRRREYITDHFNALKVHHGSFCRNNTSRIAKELRMHIGSFQCSKLGVNGESLIREECHFDALRFHQHEITS